MKNPVRLLVGGLLFICVGVGCGNGTSHNRDHGPVAPSLIFSTYLGGSKPCDSCGDALTFVLNSATDSDGNVYVTGATQVSDLPVRNAMQPQPLAGSMRSAFVTKYDPTGQILWCTYLGGDQENIGIGVAAMPGGGVAVSGLTSADNAGPFPTKNPFQAGNNGLSDYFVAVFDKDGNLQYATYLGGSGIEGEANAVFADDSSNGNNIAVDSQGLVYLTGITGSGGSESIPFPGTSNAVQPEFGGMIDAFLAIIDPSKAGPASLVYASFIGGAQNEKGHGITVNSSGSRITVVGYTQSTDFPTTPNGFRSTPAPAGFTSNGFVAEFASSSPGNSSSTYTAAYVTYLGANSSEARDDCYAVTLDPHGLIVVTGRTESADFPMLGSSSPSIYNSAPYLKPRVSNDEPYLVKLNSSLSGADSLVYATFLGGGSTTSGGGGAFCSAVAVDASGVSYVVGETSAQGTLYAYSSEPAVAPQATPFTSDALFPANQGCFDALHMQVSPDGSTLSYSTFLGAADNDRGYGLAVDPSGNVIISGLTYSTNFPLKNPAQAWPGNQGKMNGFVTKLSAQ